MPNEIILGWVIEHYSTMRKLSFRLIGAQDGDDLLHNSCEASFRSAMPPETVVSPKRWLNGIVYQTFRNMLSAKARRRELLIPDGAIERSWEPSDRVGESRREPDDSDETHQPFRHRSGKMDVDATQEFAADISKIRLAALQMSPVRQHAFFMTIFGGMSFSEAGRLNGVSHEAVRQALASARGELAHLLEAT